MHEAPLLLINPGYVPKLGVLGDHAVDWLSRCNVDVPAAVFDAQRTSDDGWIVRTGVCECMIESGPKGDIVAELQRELRNVVPGVYHSPREHTTLLLSGPKAGHVFAQTCALDFRNVQPAQAIYTRVAGVSCAILTDNRTTSAAYRLWFDPSFTDYLWGVLAQIVDELEGETLIESSRVVNSPGRRGLTESGERAPV